MIDFISWPQTLIPEEIGKMAYYCHIINLFANMQFDRLINSYFVRLRELYNLKVMLGLKYDSYVNELKIWLTEFARQKSEWIFQEVCNFKTKVFCIQL